MAPRIAFYKNGFVQAVSRCIVEEAGVMIERGDFDNYIVLGDNQSCCEGWLIENGRIVQPEIPETEES